MKPFFSAFFLIFSSLFFVSAQTYELNLDEAIKHALEYNLALRKTRIDLEASGYSEKNIWAELFPTITASAGVRYLTPLLSAEGGAFTGNNFSFPLSFDISFGLNAGIPHSIKTIRLAHQSNILRYEDACNQLSIQVTKK
ncbi:MAG: TolC family protein, partial [Treponema sp.]|nr:TolC family protein [Treponema sp.]